MTSKKNCIYILPHNDDEIFVLPKLRQDLKNGYNVQIFFLMKSDKRLGESRKFLTLLGLNQQNIMSIGEKLSVTDGTIHLHLNELYAELKIQLDKISSIDAIICTAFEGGHQDHDAASLLSRTLANHYNSNFFEFYLYNNHGKIGKFYNVALPVRTSHIVNIRYSFWDFLFLIYAPFVYRTQLKAMLGLLPFLIIKSLYKPLTLNYLINNHLYVSKHIEIPMYERWGRITQKDYQQAQSKFLSELNINLKDTDLEKYNSTNK